MKNLFFTLCLCFVGIAGFGQWTMLTTPATGNLYAVSFCDVDNGVVAGASGTIMITGDGGATWTEITGQTEDFWAACMVTPQLIFVGGDNLYRSDDGGLTWTMPDVDAPKSFSFSSPLEGVCTGITGVFQTDDGGVNWTRVVPGGTSVYETSSAFGQTSIAMGNVGGFVSYSAVGVRSQNGEWYSFDSFSFPNSNAWVSVHFPNPDTAYLFLNQYSHWVPSDHNQFVRLTGFELASGPVVCWTFQSEVLNDAIPDYMSSVYFLNNREGYACGEQGSIYRTPDGGITWEADYSGTTPFRKMQFVNNAVAYAVGDNGLVVKHDLTIGIENPVVTENSAIYPNPARGNCTLSGIEGAIEISIVAAQGNVVETFKPAEGAKTLSLQTRSLAPGIYYVRIVFKNGQSAVHKLVVG